MNIEQGLRIENENLKRLLEETERERDNLQIMVDANLRTNGRLRTLAIQNGYNPAGQLNELEYLIKRFDDIKQERDEALAQNDRLRWCAESTIEWIDSVPDDTELPAMPGFDRDYFDSVMCEQPPAALAALKAEWQADRSRELAKALGFLGSPRGETFAWSYLINIVAITKAAAERAQEAGDENK